MMVDHNEQLSLVGRWSLVIRPLDYRRRFVPMSISRGAIAGSTVGDTMNGMSNQTVDALPRVLFFGMTGSFSRTVLATLLAAQVPICGYVLPTAPQADPPLQRVEPMQTMSADDGELIILNPVRTQNSIQLAWQHHIPIFEAGNLRAPAVQNFVAKLAPDVACVACFAQRIPPALLAMPRHGFLNVHPSRLPAYRGPAPLFWQWRHGETQTGVTVHWMDERLDTGPIATQSALTLPDGSSGPQADQICARREVSYWYMYYKRSGVVKCRASRSRLGVVISRGRRPQTLAWIQLGRRNGRSILCAGRQSGGIPIR